MNSYYDVLGVAKDATADDIKKQYRKLAQKYHPDRNDSNDAKEKFQELSTAYQTLKDPHKRAEYDNPQPQGSYSVHMGQGESLHDMMRQAMGQGGFNQRRRQHQMAQITITLEEAFNGTTRTLNGNDFTIPAGIRSGSHLMVDDFIIVVGVQRHHKYQRAQDDLLTGVEITAIEAMLGIDITLTAIDGKRLKVKIPKGIQHGKLVRVAGQGMPNPEFNMRGDLLVQVVTTIPDNLTDEETESIMNVKHRKSFDV